MTRAPPKTAELQYARLDLGAVLAEARMHVSLHSRRGKRPDKTMRFALALGAQEVLVQAMREQGDAMAGQIEELKTLYFKLAKQSAEQIEAQARELHRRDAQIAEMGQRIAALERRVKQADARTAAKARPIVAQP